MLCIQLIALPHRSYRLDSNGRKWRRVNKWRIEHKHHWGGCTPHYLKQSLVTVYTHTQRDHTPRPHCCRILQYHCTHYCTWSWTQSTFHCGSGEGMQTDVRKFEGENFTVALFIRSHFFLLLSQFYFNRPKYINIYFLLEALNVMFHSLYFANHFIITIALFIRPRF